MPASGGSKPIQFQPPPMYSRPAAWNSIVFLPLLRTTLSCAAMVALPDGAFVQPVAFSPIFSPSKTNSRLATARSATLAAGSAGPAAGSLAASAAPPKPISSTKRLKLTSSCDQVPNWISHTFALFRTFLLSRSLIGITSSCHLPSSRSAERCNRSSLSVNFLSLDCSAAVSWLGFLSPVTFAQKIRFLQAETSVPASGGSKPIQFQPPPMYSLPAAWNSAVFLPLRRTSLSCAAMVALPDGAFVQPLAFSPILSPSKTTSFLASSARSLPPTTNIDTTTTHSVNFFIDLSFLTMIPNSWAVPAIGRIALLLQRARNLLSLP